LREFLKAESVYSKAKCINDGGFIEIEKFGGGISPNRKIL